MLPIYLGRDHLFLHRQTVDEEPVAFLTILSLEIKFEKLILFNSVPCSTAALKTALEILRFWTGVYVDVRRPQTENCYHIVFNDMKNLFHKVLEPQVIIL